MDVERTIEFILDAQAKHEVHLLALDERVDGIAKLLQQGMRLVVNFQNEANQKINVLIDSQQRTDDRFRETDAKFRELAEAQKVTEQTLQAFIESLQRGRNGH